MPTRLAATALVALALCLAAGSARAEAAPPCSLPQLSAQKLEVAEVALAQYRKQLRAEFSPKLQGYAKGGKLPPLRPAELERVLEASLIRQIFGLNPNTRLVRRLFAAKARGAKDVVRFFGVPLTLLDRDLVTYALRAARQANRIELYGQACAPDSYAGAFITSAGGSRGIRFAVRFKNDGPFHADALRSQVAVWPLFKLLSADFSLTELKRTVAAMTADRKLLEREGIRIVFRFIDPGENRIVVVVAASDAERAQQVLFNRYGDAVEPFFLQTRALKAVRAERREQRKFARMYRRAAQLLLGRDLRVLPQR